MKRCRRWLLLYAALVGVIANVSALRATSLIFGKQVTASTTASSSALTPTAKTTTTTTTEAPASVNITEESSNNTHHSSKHLTGIPQIDYIWDPNLPRELNGFNLSSYPFLVSVPPADEVGFDCHGKHDGFYASIKWGCQLYHHCVYGVRYDFLCSNFTAFDQKTFICHFVSEVDCKNSAKYWFRNDALYVATTTTTTSTTPAPVTEPVISATPRPFNRPRRPLRRRPQVDYYEDEEYADEYDNPPPPRRRKNNQKPRNRRPDFDDYAVNSRGSAFADDDQYEARPVQSSERNRNRQDDDYVYERPANKQHRNKANRRKPQFDYDDRPVYEQEKRRKSSNDRRKIVEDEEEEIDRQPIGNDRRKNNDDRRINYDDNPPKRQYEEDYEERPLRKNKPPPRNEPVNEAPLVKPTASGSSAGGVTSLFKNPRRPPRISRPVPLTEKKKFEYTTPKSNKPQGQLDDSEYYDDYEVQPAPQRQRKPAANVESRNKESALNSEDNTNNKRAISNRRPEPKPFKRPAQPQIKDDEYFEEYEDSNPPAKKKNEERNPPPVVQKRPNFREKSNSPAPPLSQTQQQSPQLNRNRYKESDEYIEPEKQLHIREKYNEPPSRSGVSQAAENPLILKKDNYNVQSRDPDYRDYTNRQQDNEKYVNVDREVPNKSSNKFAHQQTPKRTPYDVPMSRDEDSENTQDVRPIVRVIKRPFLPSRGGSPYLPRGLQPVGNNARPIETSSPDNTGFNIKVESKENTRDSSDEEQQSGEKRKPTLDEIYDSEYDVTLNDALNPTLKPLTSKNNRYQSTSYSELTYAPSQVRRTHLSPPITLASTHQKHSRIPEAKLDAYEDDYDY